MDNRPEEKILKENKNPRYAYVGLKNITPFRRVFPNIYKALKLIRQFSPLGKRLVGYAEKSNFGFRKRNMKSLGLCSWGFEGGGFPARIETKIGNDLLLNIAVLAHELMHGVQAVAHRRLELDLEGSLRANLLRDRATESGAQICAIIICHEMKLNGYPDAFDRALQNMGGYSILFDVYEKNYNTALEQKGDSQEAKQVASDAAFHAYYKNQPLVDIYNAGVLKNYIKFLDIGMLSRQVPHVSFCAIESRGLTEFEKDEFLVSSVKPDVSDFGLFGKNELMRQAFDYVEFMRLKFDIYDGDETNFEVQRSVNALVEDDNPYYLKATPLKTALDMWSAQVTETFTPNILKIMNTLAGIEGPVSIGGANHLSEQLSLDFSENAQKPKKDVIIQKPKTKPKAKTLSP